MPACPGSLRPLSPADRGLGKRRSHVGDPRGVHPDRPPHWPAGFRTSIRRRQRDAPGRHRARPAGLRDHSGARPRQPPCLRDRPRIDRGRPPYIRNPPVTRADVPFLCGQPSARIVMRLAATSMVVSAACICSRTARERPVTPRTERVELPLPVRSCAEMLNRRPEREHCAEDLVGVERLTAGQALHRTAQSAFLTGLNTRQRIGSSGNARRLIRRGRGGSIWPSR
jgi:hypothetical protein